MCEHKDIMQYMLLNISHKTKFKVFGERKHFKAENTRWRLFNAPYWDIEFYFKKVKKEPKFWAFFTNKLNKFGKSTETM